VSAVNSLEPTEVYNVCLSELKHNPQLVENILQEHKESQKKLQHLCERKLGLGLKIFIWSLRLYVFLMIIAVLIDVSHSIH